MFINRGNEEGLYELFISHSKYANTNTIPIIFQIVAPNDIASGKVYFCTALAF